MYQTEVDLTKLYPGREFKNYRDLCREMNWKIRRSGDDSYKAQFKRLSECCDWTKDLDENGKKRSNKILIHRVFEAPKPVKDGRKSNQKNYLTRLVSRRILEILSTHTDREDWGYEKRLYITQSSLYALIGLVNPHYLQGKNHQRDLSNELQCPIEHVMDFYNCVHSNLKKTLYASLDTLYKERLVYYTNTKRLVFRHQQAKVEAATFFEQLPQQPIEAELIKKSSYATENQRHFIFNCEKHILQKHGFKGFNEVYAKDFNYRQEFFDEVVSFINQKAATQELYELRLLVDLEYYYNALELAFCDEFIENEIKSLGELTFEEQAYLSEYIQNESLQAYYSLISCDPKLAVNQEHLQRVKNNTVVRSQKALKNQTERDSKYHRGAEDYIDNLNLIAETVIHLTPGIQNENVLESK